MFVALFSMLYRMVSMSVWDVIHVCRCFSCLCDVFYVCAVFHLVLLDVINVYKMFFMPVGCFPCLWNVFYLYGLSNVIMSF